MCSLGPRASGLIAGTMPLSFADPLLLRTRKELSYSQQVRRIAPPVLAGREEELAELSAFCLEAGRGPYTWWQAGAWAGKSALLASFVLRPPQVAEHIQIVSFFVTARLAGQDTQEAFTQALLEQLAEINGQKPPSVLPEATQEVRLLDLLARTAVGCERSGGRLVLVVDGLDEDRGVGADPRSHSIASLLPADPAGGMRVIVASRSDRPIPDDVPAWHPLRDPGVVRPLAASPYAQDFEILSRGELRRLLRSDGVEKDPVGLLTAARGALSMRDLEELTGTGQGDIEEIFDSAAGRTFARRASEWTPGAGAETYLLGHEELHAAASRYFGRRLDGYRERLHQWADSCRLRRLAC